jgi:hypothetical protein
MNTNFIKLHRCFLENPENCIYLFWRLFNPTKGGMAMSYLEKFFKFVLMLTVFSFLMIPSVIFAESIQDVSGSIRWGTASLRVWVHLDML